MFLSRIGKLTAKKTIHAPISLCYDVVKDVEKYPQFLQNVEHVSIIDKNPELVNYRVDHNLKLVGYRLSLEYKMKTLDNEISIIGKGSQYINYIHYHWFFKDLDRSHSKINLNLEIEFNDWSYYPLWLGIKDIVKEKTIMEYNERICQIKKMSE